MPTSDRPRPPSVERVLVRLREVDVPRSAEARTAAVREVLGEERAGLARGESPRSAEELAVAAQERLDAAHHSPLVVINATGVLLHTNLGRAEWPWHALQAATNAAGPVLLEMDRETGRRGQRDRRAEEHLVALTGADDALVTNNNAAAVALAVGLAGRGGGVLVSRGELVEIGGGVRIPEIVRRAGARLVEVGTTNRTRAADFEAALAEGRAKVVLRVHPSNFVQSGFTETPDAAEVADVGHRHGAIVVDDLGSGAFLPTERYGLAHEPTPAERLALGSDVVTFSGDKLVGGPQAGLVVGRADLIARLRRDPLARAMRPDKVTLAAVGATLALYRSGEAEAEIPVWRMLAATPSDLRARAETLVARLPAGSASVVALESTVGGGSLPGETLPSFGVALRGGATSILRRLRQGRVSVIGRIADDRVVLDLRTVHPQLDERLRDEIRAALRTGGR